MYLHGSLGPIIALTAILSWSLVCTASIEQTSSAQLQYPNASDFHLQRRDLPNVAAYGGANKYVTALSASMGGPFLDYIGEGDIFGRLYGLPQGGGRFAVGVRGLRGCTVVAVISKKAVYLAHLQEVPLFVDRETDDDTDLDLFREETIHTLIYPGLISLTGPGKDFHATENPRIIVVTPRTPKMYELCVDTPLRYQALAQALADDLRAALKAELAIVKGYDQMEYTEPDDFMEPMRLKGVAGRVIFEYDPVSKDYRVWSGQYTIDHGNLRG